MNITLEELVRSVGETVQKAQTHMEHTTEALYWTHFTQPDGDAEMRHPLVQRLELPVSAEPGAPVRTLEVPVAALYRHHTMTFDSVEITLRFYPQIGENGLELELQPLENDSRTSEIRLVFQNQAPAEGMARLDCAAAQLLP